MIIDKKQQEKRALIIRMRRDISGEMWFGCGQNLNSYFKGGKITKAGQLYIN